MNAINSQLQSQANESALLNTLMYLDIQDVNPDDSKLKAWTTTNIITQLGKKYYGSSDGLSKFLKDHPAKKESDFTDRQRQYQVLSNACKNNSHFASLKIHDQSWNMGYDSKGLQACTFTDSAGKVSVVYEGTGSGEWYDNGEALGGAPQNSTHASVQQEQALYYFNQVAEKEGWDKNTSITVTGHSKGGNKAQFVTLNRPDLVNRCDSFDGQGFSPEAIQAYKDKYGEDGYQNVINKMYTFAAYNDYVNVLGTRVIPDDHVYYFEAPIGDKNLVKYHYADAILYAGAILSEKDGSFNKQTEQGELSKYLSDVSGMLMSMPEPIRAITTQGAMGICQKFIFPEETINGEKISWAEMLGSIPALVESLVGGLAGDSVENFVENFIEKDLGVRKEALSALGVNLHWISGVVTSVILLACAPFLQMTSTAAYAIGTVIDGITAAVEQIQKFGQGAMELTTKIVNSINQLVSNVQDWFNKTFNSGYQYAIANPSIQLNTYSLCNYAERLININKRISALDRRLDALYLKVGFFDLLNIIQADLLVGYSWRITSCAVYLAETAADFENTEKNIMRKA